MTNKRTHYIHRPNGNPIEIFGTAEDVKTQTQYIHLREKAYNIAQQLEALSNDISAGIFGETAKSGEFMTYINSVKSQYPKGE